MYYIVPKLIYIFALPTTGLWKVVFQLKIESGKLKMNIQKGVEILRYIELNG